MQRESAPIKISTRERILNAAIARFSRNSYEATGLRDIAADVGIDVAYVHRSFGSKERLFAAAVEASLQPERFFAGNTADLAVDLTNQVLARDPVRDANEIGPLDIVVHSLSSPEAASVLREVVVRNFISPLAEKLEMSSQTPASLIASLLLGVGILRSVLGVAPLCDADRAALQQMLAEQVASLCAAKPQEPQVAATPASVGVEAEA